MAEYKGVMVYSEVADDKGYSDYKEQLNKRSIKEYIQGSNEFWLHLKLNYLPYWL